MSDAEILRLLEAYLQKGGMIDPPTQEDKCWQLGRNLGHAYCIDGQGETLRECVESVNWGDVL